MLIYSSLDIFCMGNPIPLYRPIRERREGAKLCHSRMIRGGLQLWVAVRTALQYEGSAGFRLWWWWGVGGEVWDRG